jgi:hypothetical protein
MEDAVTVLNFTKDWFEDSSPPATRELAHLSIRQPQELDRTLPITGVHPVVIKVALSAVVWFLAVTWLDFTGSGEVDFYLAVATGFFVAFFTLLLLTASMVIDDPRWAQPKASFTEFLDDDVPVDTGMMRGRDVLIQIAVLPVALAVAGTFIGLVWTIVR